MKIEDKWKYIIGSRTSTMHIFDFLYTIIENKPILRNLYNKNWSVGSLTQPDFSEATNEFHMFVHLLYKIIKENDN